MTLTGRLFIIFPVVLTLCACDRTPDGVIPPDEMASLMADIHTAESVSDTERRVFANDSMRLVLKQSVISRHGYDVATFDSSLSYYGRNIDLYAKLYEDIVTILETRITQVETQAATDGSSGIIAVSDGDLSLDGDSVDIWNLPRTVMFNLSSPVKIVPFGASSDRYWERGDIYTLRGKMSGASEAVTFSLAVEYVDGTVDYLTTRSVGNGWKEATLALDSARIARYVYGTISYPPSSVTERPTAVIDSISLYRSRHIPGITRDARTRTVKMNL